MHKLQIRYHTAQFDKIVKSIDIDCTISPIEKPGQISNEKRLSVKAAWDTGSGGCLISRDFAKKLGLISHRPIGHYYKGTLIDKNCYLVHIGLPNGIIVPVEIMEVSFTGSPLVIGMDIISKGNFFVKNISSKTVVFFEMSEKERIDINDPSGVFEIEEPVIISEDPNENSVCIKYDGIVRGLSYECKVSIPDKEDQAFKVLAVWDTGTSMSAISKSLASKLNVRTLGKTFGCSVNAPQKVDTCIINIHLFEGNTIPVLVFIQDEDERHDLLIGMDIISLGEFSIESIGDNTSLLFELPA